MVEGPRTVSSAPTAVADLDEVLVQREEAAALLEHRANGCLPAGGFPLVRGTGSGILNHVTGNARKVLAHALELSDAERSELITELAGTLPEPASDTLHPEWMIEIEHRARRALASPAGGIPWEIAEARLLARRPRL